MKAGEFMATYRSLPAGRIESEPAPAERSHGSGGVPCSDLLGGDALTPGPRGSASDQDVPPPPNKAERDAAAKYERKNSATPTPWQQHSDHLPFQIIGDMDGPDDGHFHYVSVASTDSDDANPAGVDAANARLIVQCVNNHDALVKALDEILGAYRVAVKLHDPNTDDAYSARARNAIAKALRS